MFIQQLPNKLIAFLYVFNFLKIVVKKLENNVNAELKLRL